jgi:hypothetical protein
MKVFISWSGPKSGLVAKALRDWLQDVIQALDPWMSDADIEKGARWSSVISAQLEESDFGIVCLTRDNMESPWLLFEAGALSKLQQTSRVCTFLLDVKPNQVRQPLGQFQSTLANRDDVFRLIQTINRASGEHALESHKLARAFERTWDELDAKLKRISKSRHQKQPEQDAESMLNEVLGYVRSLSREAAKPKLIHSPLTTEELVVLGKIFATNKYLSIVSISESRVGLEDGTHGTKYLINRRFLPEFLRRLKKDALQQKASRKKTAGDQPS